jgi:hypothetical protein
MFELLVSIGQIILMLQKAFRPPYQNGMSLTKHVSIMMD